MTAPARHPDPEQLAAFAAGEPEVLDPLVIQAHLDVCAACAADVDALHTLDAELAALGEPELPPGLADRLAEAVAAETAASPPAEHPAAAAVRQVPMEGPPAPVTPLRRRGRSQVTARRLLWVAAAVVVLLAVVFVGQLEGLPGVGDTVAGGGADREESEGAGAGASTSQEEASPQEGGAGAGDTRTADGADRPSSQTAEPESDEAAGAAPAPGRAPTSLPGGGAPPDSSGDQPRHDFVPEIAPSTTQPSDEQSPDREEPPSDDTAPAPGPGPAPSPPPPPSDPGSPPPSILEGTDAECLEKVEADGYTVVEVRYEVQDGKPVIVVVAKDPDAPGRVIEFVFPANCSGEPEVNPQPEPTP